MWDINRYWHLIGRTAPSLGSLRCVEMTRISTHKHMFANVHLALAYIFAVLLLWKRQDDIPQLSLCCIGPFSYYLLSSHRHIFRSKYRRFLFSQSCFVLTSAFNVACLTFPATAIEYHFDVENLPPQTKGVLLRRSLCYLGLQVRLLY